MDTQIQLHSTTRTNITNTQTLALHHSHAQGSSCISIHFHRHRSHRHSGILRPRADEPQNPQQRFIHPLHHHLPPAHLSHLGHLHHFTAPPRPFAAILAPQFTRVEVSTLVGRVQAARGPNRPALHSSPAGRRGKHQRWHPQLLHSRYRRWRNVYLSK